MADVRVVVSMATQPHREKSANRALHAFYGQDCQIVCFDGAGGAERRFEVDVLREGAEAVFLGIDDDIEYPPDYVQHMTEAALKYGVATVHGWSLGNGYRDADDYPHARTVHHFADALDHDTGVLVPGGGTVAIHCKRFGPWRCPPPDEAMHLGDFLLGREAQRRGIGPVAVKRQRGWLKPIESAGPGVFDRQADDGFARYRAFLREWLG